ncbi:hypothetical protein LguiA_025938 [Lonicera macranthoides]
MSKAVVGNEESLEKLKKLRISSLDGDDEDETLVDNNDNGDYMYDDKDDDDDEDQVRIGFAEKPKAQWSLLRHVFPSKAGGVPAWLDPTNLPSGRSCTCDICGEPLQFLLQVYADLSEKESTFHRTLFVFMCTSMVCLLQDQHEQWKRHPEQASRSVKVFRCQLPCANPFYSIEHPRYDGTDKPSGAGAALCSWCGTWKGDKICSSCKRARYCSEKHQAIHWHSSHKAECQKWRNSPLVSDSSFSNGSSVIPKVASSTLWPQYEIKRADEHEPEFDTDMSDDNGYANSLVPESRIDESVKSLLESFEGDDDKRSWASFQEQISEDPEQVLRYCRDAKAKPLWPMSSGRPSKTDIPKCSHCGSPQAFEFQIMPQLLYYFGVKNEVDSLDWATIVVYTCKASCDRSPAYKEEFVWVQLASQSTTACR